VLFLKKAIIFGSDGQDGILLSKECSDRGILCIPISKSTGLDIVRFDQVSEIIRTEKPDYIFHFAAYSSANHNLVFKNHEVISTGTLNILESVKTYSINSKVFIVGSGLQFKNDESPISEDTEFEARDPYSVSRIQSVYAARYYRRLGVRAYIGYLFNHDSQYRSKNSVSQKIVSFVQGLKKGQMGELNIGNIYVEKEWAYAGDIVNGILCLIEQDKIMEAVIGTGLCYSVKDWLEICFRQAGYDWKDFVIQDNLYIPEYKRLVSNPKKILSLGWRPSVDIDELASIMIGK
jgi:GDPmannose 4,6-dehydratase